jgi:hypothetical protein
MRISDLHRRILAQKVSFDPDAQTYINAVEFADAQSLEQGVKLAINDFVIGCKSDGIWDAIKASCILSGARTLSGALVPLKGVAPTNVNFVSGDYNRKTGLEGGTSVNISTAKYLNSNRANSADPQNDNHYAGYVTESPTSLVNTIISSADTFGNTAGTNLIQYFQSENRVSSRNKSATFASVTGIGSQITSIIGTARQNSNNYICRVNNNNTTINIASDGNGTAIFTNNLIFIRRYGTSTTFDHPFRGRIAFYSIGNFLDLAVLDARVTTLINAYNSVI